MSDLADRLGMHREPTFVVPAGFPADAAGAAMLIAKHFKVDPESRIAAAVAAERELIRLELLAEADRCDRPNGYIANALRDFARRLEGAQGSADPGAWGLRWVRVREGGVEIWPAPLLEPGTPEEADAKLTRLAGLEPR